jgi:hypothetical protein
MRMMLIQLNMKYGKLSINRSVKQITLDHHLQWNCKGIGESSIVPSADITFSTLNFMEMVIARVSVLLRIYMRKTMVWLFEKKNAWVMS